ncbi:MAG TPA: TlpA disulfide reductase family protein [Acetobacteraceae bacterium]|jgi:thiol-disulfide isomerase/thioredoxin|nr:TlpA disulfide reductase family protein [Acetobacteraceae bacterium]
MRITTRRATLLSLGAATGATVAAALLLRKPPAPHIATPVEPPGLPQVELASLSRLVPTTPPAPPPAATFLDADGAAHTLADFAGKALVVNLWATWCLPCVAELPALDALARKGAADGIVVLPLSSDRGGAAAVRAFYAAHGIATLGIWIDDKGAVARTWQARGIPTTLIIDRQGRERGRLEGAADWASDDSLARLKTLTA